MTDTWAAAAESWGVRSTVQAAGVTRDCPGGNGSGGASGGSGGGPSGGGEHGGCACHHDHDEGAGECRCRHDCHDDASGRDCREACGSAPGGVGSERCDGHRHPCDTCTRCGGGARDRGHGRGTPGRTPSGTFVGWRNPRRPGRHCGTTTGQVPGGRLDPCDFGTPPWNQWPGQRGDLYLPFLFLRANAGDLGARPVNGPFWESPDVLLAAGVDPATAPAVPAELGQTALANRPNTVYAHVWNFGIAQAPNVVVEFYWCDPSLGIGPAGVHLIGYGEVALGARGSSRAHAIVKCPVAWVPTFLNGGHECLLVRAWDQTSDGLGTPPWDAALNRHIGQRNIHVIAADSLGPHALAAGTALQLPTPVTLNVGPLYGEPAQVSVARIAPHEMPWLQQRTGVRGQFPAQAAPTGAVLLSPPTPIRGGPSTGGDTGSTHDVTGDDQQITLSATDLMPARGQAHVYRVTAAQQGQIFGGYTVVLLG